MRIRGKQAPNRKGAIDYIERLLTTDPQLTVNKIFNQAEYREHIKKEFGITRSQFYVFYKRWKESDRQESFLQDRSKRPHRVRTIDPEKRRAIESIVTSFFVVSPTKIKKLAKRHYSLEVSTNAIQKTLEGLGTKKGISTEVAKYDPILYEALFNECLDKRVRKVKDIIASYEEWGWNQSSPLGIHNLPPYSHIMLSPELIQHIQASFPGLDGHLSFHPVAGGNAFHCFRLEMKSKSKVYSWFLKLGDLHSRSALKAESKGLEELRKALGCNSGSNQCRAVVPEPLLCNVVNKHAFLLMEYLPLTLGHRSRDEEKLAQALVQLHATISPNGQYGFAMDNFIGRTPQPNTWESDWPTFFARQRLAYQLKLAQDNGYPEIQEKGQLLISKLPELLAGHTPRASLLHGDLWSGNTGFLPDGRPALFDPAVYYGDRETDLAMMELFGGFSPLLFSTYRFYAARAGNPLAPETDPAFQRRRRIYQLYHWLNHLNLFGRSYLPQVKNCLEEIRV